MHNKVLVPIDIAHKEHVGAMLKIARAMGGENAEITLLHVVSDIPAYAAIEMRGDLLEKMNTWVSDEMKVIANSERIKKAPEIRHGAPGPCIVDAAEELGSDLIVIASHKPGLSDYFLGSTAARVVRHAGCSVFVMR